MSQMDGSQFRPRRAMRDDAETSGEQNYLAPSPSHAKRQAAADNSIPESTRDDYSYRASGYSNAYENISGSTTAGNADSYHTKTKDAEALDADDELIQSRYRRKKAKANYRKFRVSLGRTIASTLIPGSGLIGTKLTWLAVILLLAMIAVPVAVAVLLPGNTFDVLGNLINPKVLRIISASLALVAVIWVAIIAGTFLVSTPKALKQKQRITGGVLVTLLAALVSAPIAVASGYAFETSKISKQVFESETEKTSQTRPEGVNPWEGKDRINILLLGGDSGESRDEDLGVRTDTIMIASIDLNSGNTVIIQLPRNLQNPPFPQGSALAEAYPYGFDDGTSSFISSVWKEVPLAHPELLENTDYPNADALKWAVEGVTGLRMDYFVMINIDGLVQLIDAMGGVTVNVNYPIAKGGSVEENCGQDGWILEGPNQHLGGEDAMWFARSRCNSPNFDFSRMLRQSCLVNAVIEQADPRTLAIRYEQVAKAAGSMIATDIPQEHLDALVELSGKVKDAQVSRLSFVYDGENGFDPSAADWDMMKTQVSQAIAQSVQSATTAETTTPTDTSTASGTDPAATQPADQENDPATVEQAPETQTTDTSGYSQDSTDYEQPQIAEESVSDACAYSHEEPYWVDPSVPVYVPQDSTER